MKKTLTLLACILLPLIIGGISGFATASNIKTWYVGLVKPSFNPPNYLFAPVWTILYLLMGIGLYLIVQLPKSAARTNAIKIFFVQLMLNFFWSILFFKMHWLGIALIEIIVMWLSIALTIHLFKPLNKWAAFIQIPYLFWVSFATILNASIWYLNK